MAQIIKVFCIGKTKDRWIEEGILQFTKRLAPILQVEWIYSKNEQQLLQALGKESHFACLDVKGNTFSSEEFSVYLEKQLVIGGSRFAFVIGGDTGLPEQLKSHPNAISFSRMTLTHDMIRLFLIEQIYRAVQIARGSPYHK